MDPEDAARQIIDNMLRVSGWQIQDYSDRDISVPGVAIREFPTIQGREPVDYALFEQGSLVGIIEAKKLGMSLAGVESQTYTYRSNLKQEGYKPVFVYESTGLQTHFCDIRDPNYRSRDVLMFHKPSNLRRMYDQPDTLRSRLAYNIPQDMPDTLRRCQVAGMLGLEKSLSENHQRALIHMTMGAGKTHMMVAESYRLLKFAKARRILFLVDRRELGRQAYAEYQNHTVSGENKKFTDLYNVQHLTGRRLEDASAVVISTVQRLYSVLSVAEHTDEEDEESMFGSDEDGEPKTVQYNNDIPIDAFDFIIVDEAHRSIYNKWRQVLEYFDAFVIGLTATPQDYTLAFFDHNLISEYTRKDSVLDGINVDCDCWRISTSINTGGILIGAGEDIMLLDRSSGEIRCATAEESQTYTPEELDRKIEAPDHIRKVVAAFKNIQDEYFARPQYVPKTLVFAKTVRHAETITNIIRDVYSQGNEFCRPITSFMKNPGDAIIDFKNSADFRIAVSVDMLGTGFDMPSLECLLFMRNVKSSVYAEQMTGRGCRTIDTDRLREATPDAATKDSYLVVDAAGALDALELIKFSRLPTSGNYKSLIALMNKVADGRASGADIETLALRINRFTKRMSLQARNSIREASGMTVDELTSMMYVNANHANHLAEANNRFGAEPTDEQIREAKKAMLRKASEPFLKPSVRNAILDAAKQDDLIITQKQDELVNVMPVNVKRQLEIFGEFVREHRDRFEALKIIYNTPYRLHGIMYGHLEELAEALKQPPYNLTPEKIWRAYERLGESKVRRNTLVRLTDLISLVRFVSGKQDTLAPYGEFVMEKFEKWLETQKTSGARFTPMHETWLHHIAEQISVSCKIDKADIKDEFHDVGGLVKFYELFPGGDQLLVRLHKELTDFG